MKRWVEEIMGRIYLEEKAGADDEGVRGILRGAEARRIGPVTVSGLEG